MNILIDKIRIKNFRALQDVEIELKPITVLVGANNAGKTTLLRALNSVLGVSRPLLNKDDLFIDQSGVSPESTIVIDLHIIPVARDGKRQNQFDTPWTSALGGSDFIQQDAQGREFFAFRSSFQFEKEDTPSLVDYDLITDWDAQIVGMKLTRMRQIRESLKMYFIDAQRDLHQDAGLRTSFFGRMVAQLEHGYSKEALDEIKALIEQANNKAIDGSTVLKHLSEKLALLNTATQTSGKGVSINPLPKNIRDLHKGMKVDFQDNGSDSFGMEYHGMGTRSWASILTAGAFVDWDLQRIQEKIENGEETNLLFPIIALEEPEAHLHPNAQRTLYGQLKGFSGQKIISTHSPYIVSQTDLSELRHFYKMKDRAEVVQVDVTALKKEEVQSIHNYMIYSRGEVLFSKIIIMVEGETEEALLPIFASSYWKKSLFELGINVVKTGKHYFLLPLLRFLKLNWFIFSDYDKPDVKTALDNILRNNGVISQNNIIKLNDSVSERPLEEYLYDEGYELELKTALKKVKEPEYANEKHRVAKQADVSKENLRIDNLSKTDFLAELENWKVKAANIYPSLILKRKEEEEQFPAKIKELFDKIDQLLNPTNDNDNEP
jgi:putative ATP-dependent endonuclease of OLD family